MAKKKPPLKDKKVRCPPKDRTKPWIGPDSSEPYDNNPGRTPPKHVPYEGDP